MTDFALWCLLIQLAATAALTGLVWFVQLVHYPLFHSVGEDGFHLYEQGHMSRTASIVGPLMFVETATALLFIHGKAGILGHWEYFTATLLLLVIWGATSRLQAPLHSKLLRGYDSKLVTMLLFSNWFRTAAWSARLVLLLALAFKFLRTGT